MVEGPAGGANSASPNSNAPAESVETKVIDGAELEVELSRTLSGQEAKLGDIVEFTVVHPVVINVSST